MGRQWIRKWQVLVSADGTNCLDTTDLDISFNLTKTMNSNGNYGTVTIYNLSANSIKKNVEKGGRVIISAGYQETNYGVIFDGDIIDFRTYLENNVNKVLEISIKDGNTFLNGFVNESFEAGMTTQTILDTFQGKIDSDISFGDVSPNLANATLPRGRVVYGTPRQVISNLAKTENGVFYINDRKINLIKADDPPTDQVYSFTPESGLIDSLTQTEEGVEFTCLLNAALNLNKYVHVSSEYVNRSLSTNGTNPTTSIANGGIYKIVEINFDGVNRDRPWYCHVKGIAQTGMVPNNFDNYVN